MDEKRPKRPDETEVEMTQLVMPPHTNPHGSLFGGQLVAWIDMAASMAAMRHSQSAVVTVSIDSMSFKLPILQGNAVLLRARVDWVGKTSMEVAVEVQSEDLLTGERHVTNHAFLTFVAVDGNLRPVEVPALLTVSDEHRKAFEEATARRADRLKGVGR